MLSRPGRAGVLAAPALQASHSSVLLCYLLLFLVDALMSKLEGERASQGRGNNKQTHACKWTHMCMSASFQRCFQNAGLICGNRWMPSASARATSPARPGARPRRRTRSARGSTRRRARSPPSRRGPTPGLRDKAGRECQMQCSLSSGMLVNFTCLHRQENMCFQQSCRNASSLVHKLALRDVTRLSWVKNL